MAIRYPTGGVISFNGHTFTVDRSRIAANAGMAAPSYHSQAAGATFKTDRLGASQSPIDFMVPIEYLIAALGPASSLHNIQVEYDALSALVGTVGTLTCFAAGDITDHIVGTARLESAIRANDDVNFWLVTLSFYCEGGMS